MNEQDSTIITHVSWGHIEVTVDGQALTFRDCKVWPGGAKEWDWSLTGTAHQPGIQPADIQEVIDRDIEVMILSRGALMKLGICPETERLLRQRGIACHIEQTERAVELFNQLSRQGLRVGGAFHSTC
jgi:hypothetical protein